MNKNGPPLDLPIAERIWSNLPCKIERKKLRVNLCFIVLYAVFLI